MKQALLILLATGSCAFAQEPVRTNVIYQSAGIATSVAGKSAVVQGAPYSATVVNESVQTLADGNRIVQSTSGTMARDSQGRTRQDTALPPIGNLSAANAPHFVFINDPVAQTSYTLNLTDKTAQRMNMLQGGPAGGVMTAGPAPHVVFAEQIGNGAASGDAPPLPPLPPPGASMVKILGAEEHAEVVSEDLGTQTMEGMLVTGTKTTRTIPAGEIGNEKPISVVTEVWTSPELKTIIYSKRTDPRMGEQTFKLTNVVRGEPDASLFTVPADFKLSDGPRNFIYRAHE